jgi:hypothetical protein
MGTSEGGEALDKCSVHERSFVRLHERMGIFLPGLEGLAFTLTRPISAQLLAGVLPGAQRFAISRDLLDGIAGT